MATIPTVADDEIIATTWGNTVATELNANAVKNTGTQSFAGLIIANAGMNIAAGGTYTTASAVRKDYIDTADAAKVGIAGAQSMAGPLTITSSLSASSFVATAGNITTSTGDLVTQGTLTKVLLGSVPADTTAGAYVRSDGVISTAVVGAGNTGLPNATLHRDTNAGTTGSLYIRFTRITLGTTIGSISVIAGPGVAYNTTSDYRLKEDRGPILNALERVRSLRPIRFRWKDEPDTGEVEGFFAHEVAEVVPGVVIGVKDAVTADGGIEPQQMDAAKMIPLLVAAIAELANQVEILQGLN